MKLIILLVCLSSVSALNIFPIESVSGSYSPSEKLALQSIFGEGYQNANLPCPFRSARSAPDQYVVKIVAEGTEMVMNAHRILTKVENLDPDEAVDELGEDWMVRMMKYARKWWRKNERSNLVKTQRRPNRIRNPKHPMSIWCRESKAHFLWIAHYSLELSREHLSRPTISGKDPTPHMYIPFLEWSVKHPPKALRKKTKWSNPPKCMPDECKEECIIQSYRNWVQKKRRTYNIVSRGGVRRLEPVINWRRDESKRPDYIAIVGRKDYIINKK